MTEILLTTIILLVLLIKKDTFDLHQEIKFLQRIALRLEKEQPTPLQSHGLFGGIGTEQGNLQEYNRLKQIHNEQMRMALQQALDKNE